MKKAIIFFLLPLAFLAPTARAAETFNDVQEEHFNGEAIEFLKENAIVEGYSDGSYKPDNRINRAEFTKIIIEATYSDEEIEACTEAPFSDVPAGEWYSKYICMAKKYGVVSGYSDNTFRPDAFINFAETSKIVAESQNIPEDTRGTGDEWFAGYVKGLENRNAIPGTIQSMEKEITRGEMSEIIYRIKDKRTDKLSVTYSELTDPLPQITSCPSLMEKFQEYKSRSYYYPMIRGEEIMIEEGVMEMDEAEATPASGNATFMDNSTAKTSGESAEEYSQTNIQVEGVDEADIVKNDGEYIYIVKGDTVRILKAYPPLLLNQVAELDFGDSSFYPRQLYVNNNQLIVIGQTSNYYEITPLKEEAMVYPPAYQSEKTRVYIYNIRDRNTPKRLRKVTLDGYYSTSRRIDDQLYLVLNVRPNIWRWDYIEKGEDILPTLTDGDADPEPMIDCAGIRYFPGYSTPEYLITASFDTSDSESKIHSNVFLGSGENVYASQTDLYVARTAYDYDRYTDWDWNRDHRKTHIFRFALEDGKMNFKARGQVPGMILNQFSMDAYAGNFRIATNSGNMWNGEDPARNNVYVLDGDMEVIGSLEGLAEGERIYSTRFIGNRLYMVTFKQVDPLFVIGLSNPRQPVVLGKLKIPGYSEYLHPYDDNHIIGFGQETIETEDGSTLIDGFKMALFDVSDVSNPKQKFMEKIGDRGTYSELLNNHKTLLFDKEKELLAFPITIYEKFNDDKLQCGKYNYSTCPNFCQRRCIPSECHEENDIAVCTDDCDGLGSCITPSWDRYETTFSGAVVYTLNLEDGFVERGRMTHYDEEDYVSVYDYFPYDYMNNIQRIIYIGDYLYSIAQGGVKIASMDSVEEIKYLELED